MTYEETNFCFPLPYYLHGMGCFKFIKMCGVNITENKNSLHCIECCWLQAQAFRSVQLYFHPWKLAADIPVSAGFISYLFSFEPEYIFFSHSVYINSHSMFPHLRRPLDFRNI